MFILNHSFQERFVAALADIEPGGVADLLVETQGGFWVIDHKTDRATDEGYIFSHYWPQLNAYREALSGLGHDIAGVGLNLVNEGKLLLSTVSEEL